MCLVELRRRCVGGSPRFMGTGHRTRLGPFGGSISALVFWLNEIQEWSRLGLARTAVCADDGSYPAGRAFRSCRQQQSSCNVNADPQNPTGIDPTEAQWREISEIVKEKKHFPFFDMVRAVQQEHLDVGCLALAGAARTTLPISRANVEVYNLTYRRTRALRPATS